LTTTPVGVADRPIEEHLLVCAECCERLAAIDALISALQLWQVAAELNCLSVRGLATGWSYEQRNPQSSLIDPHFFVLQLKSAAGKSASSTYAV